MGKIRPPLLYRGGVFYFMANRRMFSKKITNSSEFLMMSPSAQALYLHIGMNADDDGICELFTVMRMAEAKPDDIGALHARGFVFVVDSKVVIVKDWHENNLIRQDRYEKSRHLKDPRIKEVYDTVMPRLEDGLPMVNQRLPEVRLGKDRILGAVKPAQVIETKDNPTPTREKKDTSYLEVFSLWDKYPLNWRTNTTEIQAAKNLLEERGLEHVKQALGFAVKHKDDQYCPKIRKPSDLDRKWIDLKEYQP